MNIISGVFFRSAREVIMHLRHLFRVNFVFALFFGASCTFFPRWVFGLYGLAVDDPAVWTAQLVGGSILGLSTLMWFGQKTPAVDTRRAIAFALLVQDVIGCSASLQLQLTGIVNMFGWFSLALYGALAGAYAVFLFITPARC
jgi:hypothetical protein